MRKLFPYFIVIAICFLFFRMTFLHGFLPIPSDALVGLYHPFRDFYAQIFPRGVPFQNFLITDPVRQQYPWRFLAIDQLKNLQLPLWNPYEFSGYPLLANLQSAVFYPLNIVFFILPFSIAWTVLIFLSPLLAGFFIFYYLNNLKLSQSASLFGAISFAFCGFFTAWLEWGTVLHVALWLPLILLCIDKILIDNVDAFSIVSPFGKLRKSFQFSKTMVWSVILLFALCSAFFAGHVQTFFYLFCFAFFYFLFRLYKVNTFRKNAPIVLVFFIFLLITAIQSLPFFQFYLLSARGIDQADWHAAGWFIPWQQLGQFLAPDFFGNPVTLNYFGIWNYGEFIGYIGVLPFIMLWNTIFYKRNSLTLFLWIAVAVSLLLALPTGISAIPYILHVPLLATSQPTRLLFIIDFSFCVLAAIGFDYFLHTKKRIFLPIFITGIFFSLLWIMAIFGGRLHVLAVQNTVVAKHNLLLPFTIFIANTILILYYSFTKELKVHKTLTLFFLALLILDLLRFSNKFNPFTPSAYLFPTTKTISFLQSHVGNNRIMSLDSRILAPNIASYYKLQSVEGYDPLYLQRYGELIVANERSKPTISSPFGFNRIITPHHYRSQIINLLGVKYMLSLTPIKDRNLTKVFEEGDTIIYQNNNVLPRVFFTKSVTNVSSKQDAIQFLFNNDLKKSAVVENGQSQTFGNIGTATIISYQANTIVISTQNSTAGFLLLTDMYYPTWHATVDGIPTHIYQTDYTLRGMYVPSGEHKIVFTDTIL